jgi:hypothetical protein
MNGVHLFIQRSQDCLLEVSVYSDFVDRLAIQSHAVTRWRKLTIRVPRSSEVKDFLHAIVDIPTPHLSEVSLLPRERFDCAGEHLPLLSGASDALRTLTMHGCISCLVSFPHLTKLNIFRLECTYEEFRDLIQGSVFFYLFLSRPSSNVCRFAKSYYTHFGRVAGPFRKRDAVGRCSRAPSFD